jgi:hypothetical protein
MPVRATLTFQDRTVRETASPAFTVTESRFALLALPPPGRPRSCLASAELRVYVLGGSGERAGEPLRLYPSSIPDAGSLRDGDLLPFETIAETKPAATIEVPATEGWATWRMTRLYAWLTDAAGGVEAPFVVELRPPELGLPPFGRRLASASNPAHPPELRVEYVPDCA